jgi:hypothetical protein
MFINFFLMAIEAPSVAEFGLIGKFSSFEKLSALLITRFLEDYLVL